MVSKSTLKKYGLTQKEFNELLTFQRKSCALCHRPFNENGKNRRIVIDHCHSCKKVRGLVCYWCNRFLICKNTYTSSLAITEYLIGANDSYCETPITKKMWSNVSLEWREKTKISRFGSPVYSKTPRYCNLLQQINCVLLR